MNTEDILLREAELEQLITSYENKISEITARFDEIKQKMVILDGNPENWQSEAQGIFKQKKDSFVDTFDGITVELNKQLQLMKKALEMLKENERAIIKNIDIAINDVA